jgi:long-subunit acyl-CoA synthetase (AMP-forming)
MNERLDAALFAACARGDDRIALEDAHGALSYAQLAAAARGIADALRRDGVVADEPVLVPVANEPRDFATFLGVWAAGGVAVPVSREAPAAAIKATRAATGARLMAAGGGAVTRMSDTPPPARPLLAGAAIIIFTSGSTGAPKGVVLGHDAFVRKLGEIDSVLALSTETRCWCCRSPSSSASGFRC